MLTQEDCWMIKELRDQGVYQTGIAYRLGVRCFARWRGMAHPRRRGNG